MPANEARREMNIFWGFVKTEKGVVSGRDGRSSGEDDSTLGLCGVPTSISIPELSVGALHGGDMPGGIVSAIFGSSSGC